MYAASMLLIMALHERNAVHGLQARTQLNPKQAWAHHHQFIYWIFCTYAGINMRVSMRVILDLGLSLLDILITTVMCPWGTRTILWMLTEKASTYTSSIWPVSRSFRIGWYRTIYRSPGDRSIISSPLHIRECKIVRTRHAQMTEQNGLI